MFFKDLQGSNFYGAGLSVDIVTKTPISKESLLRGLGVIQRLWPELTESETSDDGESFLLATSKSGRGTLGLGVEKFNTITLFAGGEAEIREDILNFTLLDKVLSEFGLDPINVAESTHNVMFYSDWPGNHYQLIQETLLQGSLIGQVFSNDKVLDNDLYIRGLLEEPYRAAVSIDSNVSESEIIRNQFDDDFFRIAAHVERQGSPKKDHALSTLMQEQLIITERFVRDVVFPKVVLPLDKALARLKE